MADTVVDLGAGAPDMSMNEFMFGSSDPAAMYRATRPSFDEEGLGYFSRDGEMIPAADEEGYRIKMPSDLDPLAMEFEQSVDRVSPYRKLADPLTIQSPPDLSSQSMDVRGFKNAPEMYLGEGGIADLPPDFGTTEGEIDDFDMMTLGKEPTDRGIGGLLMYEDLADPQYPLRPIQSQNFGKKRGFQYGQMVQLNDRDDAVGGKLLKQAGIQTPASEVLATLDPKVVDQMSRVLGRDIG